MQTTSVAVPLPRKELPAWLLPLRNAHLAALLSLGLKFRSVLTNHAPAVDWLCMEAGHRGLTVPDGVDEAMLTQIRDQLPTGLCARRRRHWASAQDRFIARLVEEGVLAAAPQPSAPEPTALEVLCAEYGTWLHRRRGLAPGTIKACQRQLRGFLTFRFGDAAPDDLNAITPADAVSYCGNAAGTGVAGRVARAGHLRSLFRFLSATGRTDRNLALCVPRIRRRPPSPTRHLSRQEVERVLAAAGGESAMARRDHAMLLTMARLGLRGQEIVAIRLDDIDWAAGEFLVRGKGGQQATMPLPVDVGEVVVDWILHGRQGGSRHLFVRTFPPFRPFASAAPVREALRRAYAKSGVAPPGGEVRCHVFRHSLAMNLLQGGASLGDIGDMLRHRSAETTTIYARHDIQALRALARPWPASEAGS